MGGSGGGGGGKLLDVSTHNFKCQTFGLVVMHLIDLIQLNVVGTTPGIVSVC